MDVLKKLKACDDQSALVYYHTGPGVEKLSSHTIREYFSKNPAIVRSATQLYGPGFDRGDSQVYIAAATRYYNTLPSDYATLVARRGAENIQSV